MRLYLVRHGEALPKYLDAARPLSEEGRKGIERVASFLKPLALSVGEVWHSGKTRARQTAEIMGAVIASARGIKEKEGLAPDDPVAPVIDLIRKGREDLMIVGHLPFLDIMAAALLTGNEKADFVTFPSGGIACLERENGGPWYLRWMLSPEVIH